ncbi:Olfactory receptor 13C8 [Liparis tanakae]|uniref:Olfactory receptor 13C8 n=1 Tax=Liparis tanakae TaxID=230148 RepID=A0A4Z2G1U2_9TELE|nr:Olfactory receptor 13C8 [Liparis tanakae]
MENVTMVTALKQPIVFQLEGFYVPPGYGTFFFFLALLYFIIMLLANGVVLCIIVMDKNLHRPMFIMVCNLVVCDLLGATAVLPRLMMHFLMGQKKIAYISALAQAFSVHMYGVAVQTILGVMAYDRYVAISNPLRYAAIMTNKMVMKLTVSAWGVALVLVLANLLVTSYERLSTTQRQASQTILMIMAFDNYVDISYPLRYNTIMTNGMVMKLTTHNGDLQVGERHAAEGGAQQHHRVAEADSLNKEGLSQNGLRTTRLQRDSRTLRATRTNVSKKITIQADTDSVTTIRPVMMVAYLRGLQMAT